MQLDPAPFKVLGDPVRLRILAFLLDPVQSCCSRSDGICGCDLERYLGLSQPTVSHHMKALTAAGFVRAEKRGRWTYYDLEPAAFHALATTLAAFAAAAQATQTPTFQATAPTPQIQETHA